MTEIKISTSIPTASSCLEDVEGAKDVNVTVDHGRWSCEGEVTMVPDQARPDQYRPYGDGPDHWVSSELLYEMQQHFGDELQSALSELAAFAATECES